jgi:NADPH2:quinone reductase
MSLPDTMTAWTIDRFGDPEVFEARERPVPAPGAGEVLVDVAATSVNPIDYKLRSGAAAPFAPEFPAVLHGDVAGTVVAVGEDVTRFAEGDAVYGCAGGFTGCPHGALADYMPCDADLLAPAPSSLPLEEAAALPLVTLTAWEALVDKATVQDGDRVLVHGGTGGVGHVGIQLAVWQGGRVAATASTDRKREIGRSLGAEDTIDYTNEPVEAYVERCTDGRGFDVVFDTVGADNVERCFEATRLNGRMATIAAREEHNLADAYLKGLSIHTVLMLIPMMHGVGRPHHGEILREAARLVDDGTLRPLIDGRSFTFDDVGAAHAHAASGEQVGKVVVAHPDGGRA